MVRSYLGVTAGHPATEEQLEALEANPLRVTVSHNVMKKKYSIIKLELLDVA